MIVLPWRVIMFELQNVVVKNILTIDYLKINEGEITCIIGRSGGGKTTFLKLLNNMISKDEGEIRYKNRKIESYDPVQLRREVLMMVQNPVIFSKTIRDNFVKTLEYNNQAEFSDQKYLRILKKMGLKEKN